MVCEAFVTVVSDGVSCPWRLPPTMAVVAELSSVVHTKCRGSSQQVLWARRVLGTGLWDRGAQVVFSQPIRFAGLECNDTLAVQLELLRWEMPSLCCSFPVAQELFSLWLPCLGYEAETLSSACLVCPADRIPSAAKPHTRPVEEKLIPV